MDRLTGLRTEIDRIDDSILAMLAQRARLVGEVAVEKRARGLDPHQPARFAEMLARLHAQGAELGLDKPVIDAVWGAIHDASVSWQEEQGAPNEP